MTYASKTNIDLQFAVLVGWIEVTKSSLLLDFGTLALLWV